MEYSIGDLKPYIFGLPWFGKEDCNLYRFPTSSLSSLSPDMQILSKETAGAVIRFQAQTEIIGFDVIFTNVRSMSGFSSIGQFSFDVYCDGFFWNMVELTPGRRQLWVETDGSSLHEYDIYLPLYAGVELASLFVEHEQDENQGKETEILLPKPFLHQGKVVVYGSSITQGAYASRPGLAYPARLGRILGMEVINLGFGGNGKGEPEVADLICQIPDASLYIMDWGCNLCVPGEETLIKSRYPEMIHKITSLHPKTPIIFVNIQTFMDESRDKWVTSTFSEFRDVISKTFAEEERKGTICAYLDGREIVGPGELDKTVDGCHCNDWGFTCYINKIEPLARHLLEID